MGQPRLKSPREKGGPAPCNCANSRWDLKWDSLRWISFESSRCRGVAIRCARLAEYQSDRFRGYGGAPRLVLRRQSTSVATCRHYVRSIARQALTCSSQRGWPGSRARNISSPQASPVGAGVPRVSPVLRGPGTHHLAAILRPPARELASAKCLYRWCAPALPLRRDTNGNCSSATARATPPIHAEPDCGACSLVSRSACVRPIRWSRRSALARCDAGRATDQLAAPCGKR